MNQYQPSKYRWQWTLGILLLPFVATAPALAATEVSSVSSSADAAIAQPSTPDALSSFEPTITPATVDISSVQQTATATSQFSKGVIAPPETLAMNQSSASEAAEAIATTSSTVAPSTPTDAVSPALLAQQSAPTAPVQTTPVPQSDLGQVTPVNQLSGQQDLGQVTSVNQLSDVQPTDWAFQALSRLIQNYGCIAGYPDGTYRGNRPLTRYEFAAGLNACLDSIAERIGQGVSREDLEQIRRLQEEFRVELATLRGRVDALEARTSELEANQFSTTTKLRGEVVLGLGNIFAGDNAVTGAEIDSNAQLAYRVELNLLTSFTGEDLLSTRLQANNITPFGGTRSGLLGTNMGRLEFDGNNNNQVRLSLLRYRFPLGENTNFYIAATGNGFVDLDASAQLTPYLDGVAVSLFGLRNPIYNYSSGAGVGVRHRFGDALELNLGYLTPTANNPAEKNGLFDGQYGALAQLIVYPSPSIRLGFTYINSYTPSDNSFGTATGSNLANDNFGRPVVANSYGISGTIDLGRTLALGGWVGYSNQRYIGRGDGDVWTWAAALSFKDLFGEGNTGGILVGMEPRLTNLSSGVNGGVSDPDTSLHLEAFYRYRISDNIDITPGVIWITNPDHNSANDDTVVGVVRTRFFF